jgi:hypothetical protein
MKTARQIMAVRQQPQHHVEEFDGLAGEHGFIRERGGCRTRRPVEGAADARG